LWRGRKGRDAVGLERLKAALVAQLEQSGLSSPDFSGNNAGH
jgi:phosphomannomutase